MTDKLFVYVTCPSADVAAAIGKAMVEQRHTACANILPAMTSIYHWQGKIETAGETVLVLKTTAQKWQSLQDGIKALHPYDVPCIVAMPIAHGHVPYLEWIAAETNKSA